jgi:hypothetical protein
VAAFWRGKAARQRRKKCRVCEQRRLGGGEIYELRGDAGTSVYDVDLAKRTVSNRRSAELIPFDTLTDLLQGSHHVEAHLAHVDPSKPGILGQRFKGLFLLDGLHRATRCVREHHSFSAFVLSPEETLSCLMSQDLWESNVGMVVRELRQLLAGATGSEAIEVELECSAEAVEHIRKLFTEEENARIHIRHTAPRLESSE